MSPEESAPTEDVSVRKNFIEQRIDQDLAAGANGGRVVTRFPPEPNGYLHVGHAKAICLNFTLAAKYGGACNLRFDDTNPAKESQEFVDAIQRDIAWLGFEWAGEVRYASDYFEQLYQWAEHLIEQGLAFVDELSVEEIREYRGSGTVAGRPSPYRDRPTEESMDLFRRMRAGEFEDGAKVLRAKIDFNSPNMNLRDPVLYRISHTHHQRSGDAWCIYPMYDYAHGQGDAIEGVTHSLCSLEFENHRPLYEWFIEHLPVPAEPQQIEFARLELEGLITSKRKLQKLVVEGLVQGWDDPRMPTISGLRRRGYTPASIRAFCADVGVAKFNSRIPLVRLENALRDDLNRSAQRRMAILDPLEVVITDWPEGQRVERQADNNPEDEAAGKRSLHLGGRIFIEREDFMEEAPKKFKRLTASGAVRLLHGCVITCHEVVKDAGGEIVQLRCTHDPETYDGKQPADRKVKGTVHWLNADEAGDAEVRLYDRLFAVDNPEQAPEDAGDDWDFTHNLNPDSLRVVRAKVEPALLEAAPGDRFQFVRTGFFVADEHDHTPSTPTFNRAVALRDTWSKIQAKG
ncbi:MAG: glutamine--tRNA ligase/YqeY domain fusion protein [Planctomycetota bacterium]